MGILATILATRWGLSGPLATLLSWAIAAVLAAGVGLGAYHMIKRWGSQELRQQIERQNNEAGLKAGEARTTYDQCRARGGVYHFDTGICSGS